MNFKYCDKIKTTFWMMLWQILIPEAYAFMFLKIDLYDYTSTFMIILPPLK